LVTYYNRDFALQSMHSVTSSNDISTIRSKDSSAERTALIKGGRAINGGDCMKIMD